MAGAFKARRRAMRLGNEVEEMERRKQFTFYRSYYDAIKALPEVENVTVSQVYELDEADSTENVPYLDSGCEMMHTEYMHEKGYTGKGMVIAIIDGGFDTNHENFKGEIENNVNG